MEGKAFFILRLNDHIQYLRKIQATLEGTGDFHGTDYHDCKLGKWLYSTGPAEAEAAGPEAKALFDSLFEPHQRFHDASHSAIDKKEAGDEAGSQAEVTEMMKLSVSLVDNLLALDKAAKS
ncbi:MAG: CZB domain-containing protein [Chromatiaceae bacterium]|jgi:uncharacterized protein YdcH (DUF465 family)|nr:CZB domain-containing protein [Chromatiaceae bacterium]